MGTKQKASKQKPERPAPVAAGYPVATWAPAAGIGRATYYTLPDDLKPQSVLIGTRRVIIEAPADWLKRIAARGGAPIPQRKAA